MIETTGRAAAYESSAHLTRASHHLGGRQHQCDASHISYYDGSGILSAALFDGIGDRPYVADAVRHGAWYAARAADRSSPTLGLLAASAAFVDPAYLRDEHGKRSGITEDTCAAVVSHIPGIGYRYAYVGDVRVYAIGWSSPDVIALTQLSEDHNEAQRRLALGATPAEAAEHLGQVRTTLSTTISPTYIGHGTAPGASTGVLLTTDGVHDVLTCEQMRQILQDTVVSDPLPTVELVTQAVTLAGADADNASAVIILNK